MKRWMWAWMLVCVLLCTFANAHAQSGETLPELHIGCTIYSPYYGIDRNGERTGVDYELALEACQRCGYQPVFHEIEIDQRFTTLERGAVDCLWSCLSMEDCEADYLWTNPYLYMRRIFLVPEDGDIYTLEDLNGKRVGVQAATPFETMLLENAEGALPEFERVNVFSTVGEVFTALRKGYVDAIAGTEGAIRVYSDDYSGQYRAMLIRQDRLGVAFRLDADPQIPAKLTAALEEMTMDGTTAAILEKYGLDVNENLYGGTTRDESEKD